MFQGSQSFRHQFSNPHCVSRIYGTERVKAIDFNSACKVLTIKIDFAAGTRFAVPGVEDEHLVNDTVLTGVFG
ncbi:hypothetical protein DBV39_06320 [Orrella marina]|uniref:Uncharacterized protein n=1 Tax=Orrella marina TaxID=2163011 RepID=A0A2R4XHT2_9BURK|nr:hypothetical protein DBV39_06320 [Orrella marina]